MSTREASLAAVGGPNIVRDRHARKIQIRITNEKPQVQYDYCTAAFHPFQRHVDQSLTRTQIAL